MRHMINRPHSLLVCFFVLLLAPLLMGRSYPWLTSGQPPADTLARRFPAPAGFERVPLQANSFACWLRHLPLKDADAKVLLYPTEKGIAKANQAAGVAVVALDVMPYQQCADAIIRLRCEYFWATGRADALVFHFTSGDACSWRAWRSGLRPVVSGSRVSWRKTGPADSGRKHFVRYMHTLMAYCGTASLREELRPIRCEDLSVGDVIIQGGHPGHAVLVLDIVVDDAGTRKMLLGQSYMPAQEFHVLANPGASGPWYDLGFRSLPTPEWLFTDSDCCTWPQTGR